MNIDVKTPNKYQQVKFIQYVKIIYYNQSKFILGMQSWFNIQKISPCDSVDQQNDVEKLYDNQGWKVI